MYDTVMKYLRLCAAGFSTYSEADASAIGMKCALFTEAFELNGLSEDQVVAGFRYHISHGKRFPFAADIIEAARPVTAYQMDYGPKGFGAVYHASHPYVQQQTRLGVDISRYAIEVRAIDAVKAKQEAESAPPLEDYSADDDDYATLKERADARRLTWDH